MWEAKERMQLKIRQKRHGNVSGPRRKRTEYGICLAKNEHLL